MDSKLKQINEAKAEKVLSDKRHQDTLTQIAKVNDTILSATVSLITYLEGHTNKTQVVNQLKHIGTPDALKVVESVNELHETLKTHKNTDLSEVTKVMQSILDEAKKLPKELPKTEKQQFIDYTKQFTGLNDAVKSVEKVVKAQKLIAEAPVINVPETKVNVDAPDLKPLQQGFKDVVSAVKKIVIPEYKTDNKELEKLTKATNKLLGEILDKPVGGGGGGGRATPYQISDNSPAFVNLNADGSIPIGKIVVTERFDYSASPVYYVGSAPLSSSESASVWTIEKFDLTSSSNALGKKAINASWAGRAAATYV